MKLNKKDKYIYINFLKQAKEGYDPIIDKALPILIEFIERYFVSTNSIYTLEDFLQEAFIIIYKHEKYDYNKFNTKSFLILHFKKIYLKMFNKEDEPLITPNIKEEIDIDKIDFELVKQEIRENLTNQRKIIFDDIIDGVTPKETANKINVNVNYLYSLIKKTILQICQTPQFNELYQNVLSDRWTSYERMIFNKIDYTNTQKNNYLGIRALKAKDFLINRKIIRFDDKMLDELFSFYQKLNSELKNNPQLEKYQTQIEKDFKKLQKIKNIH